MDPLAKALGEMRDAWIEVKVRMSVYQPEVERLWKQQPNRNPELYEDAKQFHKELPGLQKEALAKIAAARKAFSDFRTQHWGMEKVKAYVDMCQTIQKEMDTDEKFMKEDVPGWLAAGEKVFKKK